MTNMNTEISTATRNVRGTSTIAVTATPHYVDRIFQAPFNKPIIQMVFETKAPEEVANQVMSISTENRRNNFDVIVCKIEGTAKVINGLEVVYVPKLDEKFWEIMQKKNFLLVEVSKFVLIDK